MMSTVGGLNGPRGGPPETIAAPVMRDIWVRTGAVTLSLPATLTVVLG